MEWWSVALGGPLLAGCCIVLVGSVVDAIQLAAERLRGRRSGDDDAASWGGSLWLVGFIAGTLAAGDAIVASWCDLAAWRAAAGGAGAGFVAAFSLALARWPRISAWVAVALFFVANAIASWIALS